MCFFTLCFLFLSTLFTCSISNGPNPKNVEYVLQKYEKEYKGLKYLFYPSSSPKKIRVIFAARRHPYSMWSWFWDPAEQWQDTAYLFFTDPTTTWYLGRNFNLMATYQDIIHKHVAESGLTYKDTCMIGSSMGGYGALLYGLVLNVKTIIAIMPQLNYDIGQPTYDYSGLSKNEFIDIDELILKTDDLPLIYIQESQSWPDNKQLALLMQKIHLRPKYCVIVNKTSNLGHGPFLLTKGYLEKILHFFDSLTFNMDDQIPRMYHINTRLDKHFDKDS